MGDYYPWPKCTFLFQQESRGVGPFSYEPRPCPRQFTLPLDLARSRVGPPRVLAAATGGEATSREIERDIHLFEEVFVYIFCGQNPSSIYVA